MITLFNETCIFDEDKNKTIVLERSNFCIKNNCSQQVIIVRRRLFT